MPTAIPRLVFVAGAQAAERAGVDEADGVSLAAESWATHGPEWGLVTNEARFRCIDVARKRYGRGRTRAALGDPRAPLAISHGIKSDEGDYLDSRRGAVAPDTGRDTIAGAEARADVAAILSRVPQPCREVLVRRWIGDETLAEIGRALGVTESRASQLHTKGLEMARRVADRPDSQPQSRPEQAIPSRRPPDQPGAPPLTRQQIAVLQLMADGHTRSSAATRLHLAENTIKSHLENAAKVAGTHGTTHLVATALRTGLIA